MLNTSCKNIILSEEYKKEKIDYFNSISMKPTFKFVYTENLLKCIEECENGYYNIKNLYKDTLNMMEILDVHVDCNQALEDMYIINEIAIKELTNIYLVKHSVESISIISSKNK